MHFKKQSDIYINNNIILENVASSSIENESSHNESNRSSETHREGSETSNDRPTRYINERGIHHCVFDKM